MRISSFLAALALLTAGPVFATQQELSGTAKALDGDSLEIAGIPIRLSGIDAPEAAQSCVRNGETWQCGEDAAAFLRGLVDGHSLNCISTESDEYGRLVATCHRDGFDVGLTLIEAGLAVTRDNSPGEYIAAESIRKANRIGIWASTFQQPAEWRAANPQAAPAIVRTAKPKARTGGSGNRPRRAARQERTYRNSFGCTIKGNHSRYGDWIYHLPGMKYYNQTRPEALFCTEAAARRAGYRRSKA